MAIIIITIIYIAVLTVYILLHIVNISGRWACGDSGEKKLPERTRGTGNLGEKTKGAQTLALCLKGANVLAVIKWKERNMMSIRLFCHFRSTAAPTPVSWVGSWRRTAWGRWWRRRCLDSGPITGLGRSRWRALYSSMWRRTCTTPTPTCLRLTTSTTCSWLGRSSDSEQVNTSRGTSCDCDVAELWPHWALWNVPQVT